MKQFLTIDEQINLMLSRDLIIKDIPAAKNFLLNHNYYRLNPYLKMFADIDNNFSSKVFLEDLIEIYQIDALFRHITLLHLEKFEINFKTKFAYFLAKEYSPDCLYKDDFFNPFYVDKKTKLMDKLIKQNNEIAKHHRENYDGVLPTWAFVELATFGEVSTLFKNLSDDPKNYLIENIFGFKKVFIENWLESLVNFRNVCAHYGYLYNRNFSTPLRKIKTFDRHQINSQSYFSRLLILSKLLGKADTYTFNVTLDVFINRKNIDVSKYGFKPGWEKIVMEFVELNPRNM